jgi:hypothetical protein
MVRRQCFRSRIVPVTLLRQPVNAPLEVNKYTVKTQHELRKILIVLEHKRANRIVVHHLRLPAQHIGHDRPIALEAICLCNIQC